MFPVVSGLMSSMTWFVVPGRSQNMKNLLQQSFKGFLGGHGSKFENWSNPRKIHPLNINTASVCLLCNTVTVHSVGRDSC